MIISAIVATSRNLVIGRNNQIPWYLSADLKYFKKTTLNHHVIMGRKSFASIGRPLPKRTNVVITRDLFFTATGCLIAHSIEEALELAYANGEEEAFIIGGAQIYEATQDLWDRLYLTEIDIVIDDGDAFFPQIDYSQWELVSEEPHEPDEKNELAYNFKVWDRKIDPNL
jgi:dihydrofolate reductase